MHSWALVIAKSPNTQAYNIESRLMDALFGAVRMSCCGCEEEMLHGEIGDIPDEVAVYTCTQTFGRTLCV